MTTTSVRHGPALLAMLLAVLVSPCVHAELKRVRFGAKKQVINEIHGLQQSIDKLAQQGWVKQMTRPVADVHQAMTTWIGQLGNWRKAKVFVDPNPALWRGSYASAEWKRGRFVFDAHQAVEQERNGRSLDSSLAVFGPADGPPAGL